MKVGFIGLGKMGHPMAAHIRKAGFELLIHDVRREAGRELEAAGAVWCGTPAEAAHSDVLLTCLPSPGVTEEMLLGDDGVFAELSPGASFIDTGTNPPSFMRRLSALGRERGIHVLDAPISGGVSGAQDATLTIFVGGAGEDLERVRPVLEPISRKVVHAGPSGSGNVIKLINNLMLFVNYLGVCEGVTMGVKAGIDPKLLLDVITPSMGQSRIFEQSLAAFLEGNPMGATTDLVIKDMRLAIELADELGVPADIGALARDIFARFRDDAGGGEEDYTELMKDYFNRSGAA